MGTQYLGAHGSWYGFCGCHVLPIGPMCISEAGAGAGALRGAYAPNVLVWIALLDDDDLRQQRKRPRSMSASPPMEHATMRMRRFRAIVRVRRVVVLELEGVLLGLEFGKGVVLLPRALMKSL
jgi:hypothetical protein